MLSVIRKTNISLVNNILDRRINYASWEVENARSENLSADINSFFVVVIRDIQGITYLRYQKLNNYN